jgi:glycosyltransferase involved in cell wall biosynthesis
VGNLSVRKGVPELLRALALSPLAGMPLRLTLAGGGDIEGFRTIAQAMGLGDRVCFAGWTEQAQVARLMSEADVLVLPSHDEGLPLVILEALACGVPVVCTPVGEIPHILQDRLHARFVAPGDVAGLARTLATLLADASQRAALSQQGRSLYRQSFALPRFFDQIAALHLRHFGVAGQRTPDPAPARTPASPQEAAA